MSKNLITGYDLSTDEFGQRFNKNVPTIKTATVDEQRIQELMFNHNNRVVKLMY
jgi:hypothetical protein